MKRRILTIGKHVLLAALIGYLAFVLGESLSRTSRLFPARSDAAPSPPPASLALATSHELPGGGIAYHFPGAAKSQPLPSLLIAPGGDESPLAWADISRDTAWLGHDVLLVHYPGFQGAPGKLSTPSLQHSLSAAAALLRDLAPGRPLVGYGRDIGGAALAHLAPDLGLDGLVLLSTYRSTRDLTPTRFTPPGIGPWRYDNRVALAQIEIPTLIFHGRDDNVVPMDLALDLAPLGPHIDFYRIGVARELSPYHWNYVKERVLRLLKSLTYPPLPPTPNSPPDPPNPPEASPTSSSQPEPTTLSAPSPSSPRWTQQSAQAALRRANPEYNGDAQIVLEAGRIVGLAAANTAIADLSPLAGEPIRQLELTATAVRDLSPLQGMPVEALFIEQTLVEDLSPLRGAPLESFAASECPRLVQIDALAGAPLVEIRLTHTRVADLSALAGAPLQAAWFSFSPVVDISPLKGAPLVTLTLHRTQVADLSPLAGTQLQRLHIGETLVTDLSPLAGLPLTRLVFTPFLVEQGIDAVRQNAGLREIGTRFNDQSDKDLMPPAQFWPQWDAFQQERARQLLSPNPPRAPRPAPSGDGGS